MIKQEWVRAKAPGLPQYTVPVVSESFSPEGARYVQVEWNDRYLWLKPDWFEAVA